MRRAAALLLIGIVLIPAARAKDPYRPGDVWHYHTRPNEPESTLTILKIENLDQIGPVVHIRVDKVRLKNCSGGPEPDNFQHMPFTREAFERSITDRIKEDGPVPTMEGYEIWKRDKGGVYTITVAEAIEVAEYTFNQGKCCR